jgi:DNA-binding transcriptional MerR regulator
MQYRIGQFAQLSGVSAKTLRFYDQIGLLRPAGVDPRTRYRLYLSEQLSDLAFIIALKDLGASLREIAAMAGRVHPRGIDGQVLARLRSNAELAMTRAQQNLARIDLALAQLEERSEAIPIQVKKRPAIRVAAIRASIRNYAEIEEIERVLRAAVQPQAVGTQQGVLWHRCADSGSLEGEPFVELRGVVRARGPYELKQLPSATVASAYCESNDNDAERTYDALRSWMRVQGYRLDGPKREIYRGRMLEIQFPLKS